MWGDGVYGCVGCWIGGVKSGEGLGVGYVEYGGKCHEKGRVGC